MSTPHAESPQTAHEALYLRYLAEGDVGAFDLLVGHYQHHAFRIAVGVCGLTHGLAEEAVQEAFTQLAGGRSRFEDQGPGSFRAFFSQLVLYVARNYRVREQRLQRREQSEGRKLAEREAHHGVQNPDDLDREEQLSALRGALDGLQEDLRVPIVLHFMSGLSQTEAANILGVNASQVSRRISQGLDLLRRRLGAAAASIPAVALPELLADEALLPLPPLLETRLASITGEIGQVAAEASRRLSAPARFHLWPFAAAGVLMASAGAAWWWTHEDPAPAVPTPPASAAPETLSPAPEAPRPPAEPHWRWTFENGVPKDLELLQGEWNWQAAKDGKPAGLRLPTPTFIRLPVEPGQALKVSSRGYSLDPKKESKFGLYFLDGEYLAGRRLWTKFVQHAQRRNSIIRNETYLLGRHIAGYTQGKLSFVAEREEGSGPPGIAVSSSNLLLVEVEARALTPGQVPDELRNPEQLIESLGVEPIVIPRRHVPVGVSP